MGSGTEHLALNAVFVGCF